MGTLVLNKIEDTSGNEKFTATAWVNFDGTTGEINDSGNITSISDNEVGDFTLNFSTDMDNTNYTMCIGVGNSGGDSETSFGGKISSGGAAVGSLRIRTQYTTDTSRAFFDYVITTVVIFGGR